MGTRTYSRRGSDGTRRPTALGIRTGKFRGVRESSVPGGGYKEVTVPVGSNDVTYNLNTDVFDETELVRGFAKLNTALANADAVGVMGDRVREDGGRFYANVDEDSRITYTQSMEAIADVVREVLSMIETAHDERKGSFSDDFQYRETEYFTGTQLYDLDRAFYNATNLFDWATSREYDRNLPYPYTMSSERGFASDTVTGNNSLALERMRDVIDELDVYIKDARNEGNADIADIADPLQAMSSQAKRIFNTLLNAEQRWMRRNIINQLQYEEGLTPATRVTFSVKPFVIDEE